MADGALAMLCRDYDFRGRCQEFAGDVRTLTGTRVGNDQVSSFIVGPRRCSPPRSGSWVILYADSNYNGACYVFTTNNPGAIDAGQPALRATLVGNDRVSSIRVAPGVFAELCIDERFGGGCAYFSADDPNLTNNSLPGDGGSCNHFNVCSGPSSINDRASSVRIFESSGR